MVIPLAGYSHCDDSIGSNKSSIDWFPGHLGSKEFKFWMLEDSVASICRHECLVYLIYMVVHSLNHTFGFSKNVADCGSCDLYTVGCRYGAAQRMVTYVVLNWPWQNINQTFHSQKTPSPMGELLGYLLWGVWRVTASHYNSENWCSLLWVPLIYGRCSWYYRPGRNEPSRTPRTIESNDGVSSQEISLQTTAYRLLRLVDSKPECANLLHDQQHI